MRSRQVAAAGVGVWYCCMTLRLARSVLRARARAGIAGASTLRASAMLKTLDSGVYCFKLGNKSGAVPDTGETEWSLELPSCAAW